MQTFKDMLGGLIIAIITLYVLSFLVVGVCVLDVSKPISTCRDNSAGMLIYKTINAFN